MPGLELRLGLGLTRRGGGAAFTPAQQILDLATADGWTAVYDPTNPDTRTLRSTFVSQIDDGLGNLAAVAQATEANQPDYTAGAFGQLDACTFKGASSDLLVSSTFISKAQPNFVMAVGRVNEVIQFPYLFDLQAGTTLSAFLLGSSKWNINAGTTLPSTDNNDLNAHIFEVIFNGASSSIVVDGVEVAAGAAGANGANIIAIGNRADGGGGIRSWDGPIGPLLYFDGNPSSTVRSNMRSLLSNLTGIAIA